MSLRPYQQQAIDDLYDWFGKNHTGNPCIVLPTGAGKSHIVAQICKDAVREWNSRVLMLTHVKELIQQNAEKMRQHWPNAPMGVYSAGLGKRQAGEPITFAGIQSVRNKADMLGRIEIAIIDEAHLVSHRDEGGYRKLIADLKAVNPNLRVIGLTATPMRLGHGLITDGEALFDDLLEPVTIEQLVHQGYLARLTSKVTTAKLTTDGVHKRGGEFIEKELQAAVDVEHTNESVVQEVIRLAGDRKSWLFFCTGVDHSHHIRDCLREHGVAAETITGKTPKAERAEIIDRFKSGEIKALTNANVLTTGFDYPDIDLIVMLRPTMSASLYIQMAGRGLRPKSHTDHCLVLDFAGVVEQHGPITNINVTTSHGDGTGEAPSKACEECGEIVHPSVRECPECGTEFPPPPERRYNLHDDDIMGSTVRDLPVCSWQWRIHTGKRSGKEMLRVTYYGSELSSKPISEYLTIMHEGFAGQRAIRTLMDISAKAGCAKAYWEKDMGVIVDMLNNGTPPKAITYKMDGKYHRVLERTWQD